MKSRKNILKPIFYFIFLLFIVTKTINSQLSSTDLNYIKKTLLSAQEESNGLFGKSIEITYKSIASLKLINEPIPHSSKICREISFEVTNQPTIELLELNEILNCKLNFNNLPSEMKDEEMMNLNLETLYKRVLLFNKSNAQIKWDLLFENIKAFITSGKLFSNQNGSTRYSLLSTAYGLKMLYLIHDNLKTDALVNKEIVYVLTNIQKEFQLLREDIGIFSEYELHSIIVNSELIQAISQINSLISIENYEDLCLKILNYFVNFKYGYTSLDNIFYLLKGIDTLSHIPIVKLEKKVYEYVDEKSITLRILNGFGQDINEYVSTFSYKLKESREEVRKNEYDLDDESNPSESENSNTVTLNNSAVVSLDLSNLIEGPGKFNLITKVSFNKGDKTFEQNLNFALNSISKVKLNHLKMAVTNTQDKNDEKEITVEYPKRTFKNMKAIQNSVIKLKVKLNYGDNQVSKVEQFFLRLRHTELGKTYSAYVYEYKSTDDYYYINFDMSDPAYDGIYELTLILSDVGLENPMIWNFGKIEVKFRKPMDPTNLIPSYKNKNKEKMEPTFPVEESPNKNLIGSLITCSFIVGIFIAFLYYLKSHKANLNKFPKVSEKSNFIFSIGFVVFILLVTYVMILFFIKLNIIQTFIIFLALGVPGSVVIYKSLSNITIEV